MVGFKCFLIHSGVDEFPNVTEDDLREAMPELGTTRSGIDRSCRSAGANQ